MGQAAYKFLWAIGFVVVALHIVACGNSPSSPVGTPTPATATATSGPALAAWWDANRKGLRTVYGVAGAAYQGPPNYNDGSYAGASACMRSNVALLTGPSGSLFTVSLSRGIPIVIASDVSTNASMVFSPSCTSSFVYTRGGSRALLVQGLLSTPKITTVTLPTGTSAAAVADSGSILVEIPGADQSAVIELLANANEKPRSVTVLSQFGGMAFLPGTDAALLADAGMSNVIKVSHLSGDITLTPIAGTADGVLKPSAVAVSADGRLAAVLNNGSSVLRLDLSGKSASVTALCHCAPTELEPLAGNFAFRLNEPGAGTVWAFDGNSPQPRIFFIPSEQVVNKVQRGSR
jgi:hypothetical protein